AANPNGVVGLRQVRNQVAPLIVGDDDLGVPGLEIRGFRNHPDTRLGSVPSGDHSTDGVRRYGRIGGGRIGGDSEGPRQRRDDYYPEGIQPAHVRTSFVWPRSLTTVRSMPARDCRAKIHPRSRPVNGWNASKRGGARGGLLGPWRPPATAEAL